MNKQSHHTIHSLVPVYAALSRIVRLAVELDNDGNTILLSSTVLQKLAKEIRLEADYGMSDLVMLEAELVGDGSGRRKYERARIKEAV